MTYAAGSTILADDYNSFVNNGVGGNSSISINQIWNNSATVGYGQANLSTVTGGSTQTITATQWASLVNTLANIGAHQATTLTSRTAPVAGNTITILANVATDITNCRNNAPNAAAQGTEYGIFTGTTSKTTTTGSGTTAWTITFTHTVTFANNTAFRNFFNAGGTVKWQTNKSSTGTEADDEWNDLASNLSGNIIISRGEGNSFINGVNYTGTLLTGNGSPAFAISPTIGAFNLTTTATTTYQHYADTSPYTGQNIRLQASVNSNTTPTVITLSTVWTDPGGSGAGSTDAITGGTATTSPSTTITGTAPTTLVTYLPPSTTYLVNTWGTPTIAASVT